MDGETFGAYTAGSPPNVDGDGDRERETTKHAFVHVSMHADWVKSPMQFRVNRHLEISVNGGPWHGSAIYDNTTGKGKWTMTFHFKAKLDRLKVITYTQILGTAIYMNLDEKNSGYNSMLITKTHALILYRAQKCLDVSFVI